MKRNLAVLTSWRTWALSLALMVGTVLSSPAYTLLVAPARYSVMQVAFDLLGRTPSVLVSYQGEGTAVDPVLHAWNGSEWVLVTLKDYREGNFLQRTPDRIILIGDDTVLPSRILDASTWVSDVVRIRDLTTGSLVNEFGHILKWRDADWAWFAKRYNLNLQDESAARRSSSWYDRTGPLPDRPRILERVLEGPAREPAPVPVLQDKPIAQVEPIDPPALAPVVDSAPMVDAGVTEPAATPVAPAVNPGVDAELDQKTEAALQVFE